MEFDEFFPISEVVVESLSEEGGAGVFGLSGLLGLSGLPGLSLSLIHI